MTTVLVPTLTGALLIALVVSVVGYFADLAAEARGYQDGYNEAMRGKLFGD